MSARRCWALGLLLLVCTPLPAQDDFEALLQQIQQASATAQQINTEREQRFLRNRNEQAELLRQAQREQAAAQRKADAVKAAFDANQKALEETRRKLKDAIGDLGQMYAGIRQSAGEFREVAADSLITAQFPKRVGFLDRLATQKELPSIRQIETLWFALMQDMTETGRIARFDATVVDVFGSRGEKRVTRVGPFAAFVDDVYLSAVPGGEALQALPRQPSGRYRRLAAQFDERAISPILIDPSLGRLLELEAEKPTLLERVHQGGVVGYVILVIAVVGVLVALFQLAYLTRVGRRVNRQLADIGTPRADNPLGRVLGTFHADSGRIEDDDAELLELRLSEAVLRETPRLERFQSMLRLFAAVAPLLGLLGTVTGMIATFQAITVFGTGDPKLMAGGISQALVTTVMGLLTAIPILFLNSLIASRSRALVQVLDEQSAGLLARQLEVAGAGPESAGA